MREFELRMCRVLVIAVCFGIHVIHDTYYCSGSLLDVVYILKVIQSAMFIPAYSEPFLYVTYFNSVQGITIPADKSETRLAT